MIGEWSIYHLDYSIADSSFADICSTNYSKAFVACRKHRIDFNVFLEHKRDAFMGNLSLFVEQVDDIDYINLFLTSIGLVALPMKR